MRAHLTRLLRDTRGVSAVEFAMILPIIVILAVGTIEFGRLLLLTQKLQNGSFILADLTARDRVASRADLENVFFALTNIIQPFEFATAGTAILTSVSAAVDDAPVVNWQLSGAGTLAAESRVGAEGEAAILPEALEISAGETVIVAEVFYDFQPIFGVTTGARLLHKVAYHRPRLGTLDTLGP